MSKVSTSIIISLVVGDSSFKDHPIKFNLPQYFKLPTLRVGISSTKTHLILKKHLCTCHEYPFTLTYLN